MHDFVQILIFSLSFSMLGSETFYSFYFYFFYNMEQEAEVVREPSHPSSAHFCDDVETQTCLAGESQAVDGNGVDDSLLCNEIFDSYVTLDDSGLNGVAFDGFARFTNDIPGVDNSVICGIVDLENLELDTPPDFQLAVSFFYLVSSVILFTSLS